MELNFLNHSGRFPLTVPQGPLYLFRPLFVGIEPSKPTFRISLKNFKILARWSIGISKVLWSMCCTHKQDAFCASKSLRKASCCLDNGRTNNNEDTDDGIVMSGYRGK